MTVGNSSHSPPTAPQSRGPLSQWSILSLDANSSLHGIECSAIGNDEGAIAPDIADQVLDQICPLPSKLPFWQPRLPRIARKLAKRFVNDMQDSTFVSNVPKRKLPQRPSALPQFPDISELGIPVESNVEYAILVSMYEVYNDRIFDLLAVPSNQKDLRRRHLLFKSTVASPDRKVVAGLRKVVCGNYEEALMVLETGLTERRVAGTGSNSVSSRSHGFFCVEVKRRPRGGMSNSWTGANLTIVDLAGEFCKGYEIAD